MGRKRWRAGFLFVNDFCNEISSYCRQQGQSAKCHRWAVPECIPTHPSCFCLLMPLCLCSSAVLRTKPYPALRAFNTSPMTCLERWGKLQKMEGIYYTNLPQSLQTALITHFLLHMTVPTYVEYKAVFDVVFVNIRLPFQHKQVVQTLGACLIFVFTWARLYLALRAVCPNFALPAHITLL